MQVRGNEPLKFAAPPRYCMRSARHDSRHCGPASLVPIRVIIIYAGALHCCGAEPWLPVPWCPRIRLRASNERRAEEQNLLTAGIAGLRPVLDWGWCRCVSKNTTGERLQRDHTPIHSPHWCREPRDSVPVRPHPARPTSGARLRRGIIKSQRGVLALPW